MDSDSDDGSASKASQLNIEILFQTEQEVSSEDVPKEEWSSLLIEVEESNVKKLLYAEDLYDPGSGEICAKYMPLSASSVFRHPYYKYPAIEDPGIEQALFEPRPTVVYSDDGQELYLALCEEMCIAPIRSFHKSLLSSKVDLGYYGISTKGFRAISLALQNNRLVKVLDLTDNWMNKDACYHLGEVLRDNNTIEELILTGCRIGEEGAQVLFHHLTFNRNINKLDVSRNQLGNKGVEYLAQTIFKNQLITNINLSYNDITAVGVTSLVELFERRNKVTHLNLSWNSIMSPNVVFKLCQQLMENKNFVELDLSWNSLNAARIGTAIKLLLVNAESIKTINLSNNRLSGLAIKFLGKGLPHAKKLETLDLSCNPLTAADALLLLEYFRDRAVKLKRLIMDDVVVDHEFVEARKEILSLKYRRDTVVTHGYARSKTIYQHHDIRYLILKRLDAMCRSAKVKKNRVDFPVIILEMYAEHPGPLAVNYFTMGLKVRGLSLSDVMMEEISTYFPGPRGEDKNKSKTISLEAIVDYIKRLWPDKKARPPQLPPTPPPEVKQKGKEQKKKQK